MKIKSKILIFSGSTNPLSATQGKSALQGKGVDLLSAIKCWIINVSSMLKDPLPQTVIQQLLSTSYNITKQCARNKETSTPQYCTKIRNHGLLVWSILITQFTFDKVGSLPAKTKETYFTFIFEVLIILMDSFKNCFSLPSNNT